MSDEYGNRVGRSWSVGDLEDNEGNYAHDADGPKVSCPECDSTYNLSLGLAIRGGRMGPKGVIDCERCGATYELRLVEVMNDE